MSYRFGPQLTVRRCAAMVRELAIPAPFELEAFRARLEGRTGRIAELVPAVMPAGAPSGTLLRTAGADYLCYERHTSPLHQAHIVLSLAAHLVLGVATGPLIDRRLVPDLSPQLVRLMLGDGAGRTATQEESETFAFLVLERAGAAAYPPALAWRALRRLMPLRSALCSAIPEAVSVVPGARRAVRFRLYQRVIEIRDAALTLRPYRDPEVASAAGRAARAAGLSGGELAAMVEAAVLASAVRTWNAGRPALRSAGDMGHGAGLGSDLRSEADWLVTVSRAFGQLCQDGETGRLRGSRERAGPHGGPRGKRSPAAPLNAWSLY